MVVVYLFEDYAFCLIWVIAVLYELFQHFDRVEIEIFFTYRTEALRQNVALWLLYGEVAVGNRFVDYVEPWVKGENCFDADVLFCDRTCGHTSKRMAANNKFFDVKTYILLILLIFKYFLWVRCINYAVYKSVNFRGTYFYLFSSQFDISDVMHTAPEFRFAILFDWMIGCTIKMRQGENYVPMWC